jgi:hypothetical protein
MKTDQATTPDESLGAGQLGAIIAGRARLREARKSERASRGKQSGQSSGGAASSKPATAEVSMVQDYAECTSDDDGSGSDADNEHWGFFMEGVSGQRGERSDDGVGEAAAEALAGNNDSVSADKALERAVEAQELVVSQFESGKSTESEFRQAVEAHNIAVERYECERFGSDQAYNCEDGEGETNDTPGSDAYDPPPRLETGTCDKHPDTANPDRDNEPIPKEPMPLEMAVDVNEPVGCDATGELAEANARAVVRTGVIHAYAFFHDVHPSRSTSAWWKRAPQACQFGSKPTRVTAWETVQTRSTWSS